MVPTSSDARTKQGFQRERVRGEVFVFKPGRRPLRWSSVAGSGFTRVQ
jgi:hypothetical protein